ncbi:hypothetical protein [Pleionea mediterranea]|uniref:Uncharacterized protein n=1 Tax=Pleionea mediterranea TaxID=523701 RepID=A0A316G056_9GAMM|nr:hypothetical protein [Pleionea mediterranea]PWK53346.1 hypothetical protein C8D97_103173 [Pleionea mediterranea]
MSLQSHLERLKNLLSEQDLQLFEQLSERLNNTEGDFTELTEQDLALIAQMEKKYGDKIHQSAVENLDEVVDESKQMSSSDDTSEHEVVDTPDSQAHQQDEPILGVNAVIPDEFPLLKTEFALYVKDMLLRELGEQFSSLKASVSYAFEKKWIPQELQNPDVCETLFERFFSDIEQANQWRYELQGQKVDSSNKSMAVGLTWFMYVFQLKQWLDKHHS